LPQRCDLCRNLGFFTAESLNAPQHKHLYRNAGFSRRNVGFFTATQACLPQHLLLHRDCHGILARSRAFTATWSSEDGGRGE